MWSRISYLVYEKNLLWSTVAWLLVPLAIVRLIWRGLRHRPYFGRWRERFGFVVPVGAGHVIWVHAVSVGEVRTIVQFIQFLRTKYPESTILVTTMTPTGSEQVRQSLGDSVLHCYLPYDLPAAIRRFLDRVHPDLAFIVETEFWPNVFRFCDERGIPIFLINVRVSPGSFRGYSWFPKFTRRMLERVTILAAQSDLDAERLNTLGAPKDAIRVTGNLKFDVRPRPGAVAKGAELRQRWGADRPIWIAASTHEGEERKVLKSHRILLERLPDALLVVVPRHAERFSKVVRLCRQAGFATARRSETREDLPEGTNVLVGDTMGELADFYAAADVAFMGGSLIRHGGHNLIEAMAVGVPVIFGPYIFNFEQSSNTALLRGAARQVRGSEQLAIAVFDYIDDVEYRQQASVAARAVVTENRGALQATEALVCTVLGEPVPEPGSVEAIV